MTLKSISLLRAASDNAGLFVDAGNELVVGDEIKAGVITADRAAEIVASHGATGHHAKPAVEKPKKPARVKKAKPAPKALTVSPTPPPPPPPPPAQEPAPEVKDA